MARYRFGSVLADTCGRALVGCSVGLAHIYAQVIDDNAGAPWPVDPDPEDPRLACWLKKQARAKQTVKDWRPSALKKASIRSF